MRSAIDYHFIRNATARLRYAGVTFLLDPMLSEAGALPSFAGIAPNPTVDLPLAAQEVVAGIDAVIVSHLHGDHFDPAAIALLDKGLPVLTPRNGAPADKSNPQALTAFAETLRDHGFTNVIETATDDGAPTVFRGITIRQVHARHGRGHLGEVMGGVNGLIFSAPGAPTIYWAGDTIFDDDGQIAAILDAYRPDVVIAHCGGPVIAAISPEKLLMDAEEAAQFMAAAFAANPEAEIVAIHMEALDHCFSSRDDLRRALESLPAEQRARVHIPNDGARLTLAGGQG